MKLNFKFVIPLFVTTAVSAALPNNNGSEISEACIAEMMNIEYCISQTITKENIGSICTVSKSEDCQRFYTDPMSVLPSCQNFKDLIIISAQIFNNSLSLMCETDETGNICPFTEYELASVANNNLMNSNVALNTGNIIPSTNNDILNAIKNTCISAKCKAATQKYIQYLIDNNDKVTNIISTNYQFAALQNANIEVINELKNFLEILNGSDCIPTLTPPSVSNVNDNIILGNNTVQANQLKVDQNSYGFTRYITKPTIISFAIYMVLYFLMFKFILI